MPIHDWTRVTAGVFHSFHTLWIGEIVKSLNAGVLPNGVYAMAEQVAGGIVPDVLTLSSASADSQDSGGPPDFDRDGEGGLAVATAPPRTAIHDQLNEAAFYAAKRRRVVIRHTTGDRIVALLEIVSLGNKSSADAVNQFVDKAASALNSGFHLMVIDLFPPGTFDPDGMHGRLWASLGGQYRQPESKPLTLASYSAGGSATVECFVEPTAVGTPLIDMPMFISPGRYVSVALEKTYMAAYSGMPARWRQVIEAAST